MLGQIGVACVHELQHFPFGDDVGRIGQDLQHAHPTLADHHLKCARIQEVADQHRRRVAELGVGRGVTAPHVGFVDDIVVQQRGGVDHLDDRGENVMVGPSVPGRTCGQQQQGRAQPLAAAGDDVFGDLPDENNLGIEGLAHDAVDGVHVGADRSLQEIDDHEWGSDGSFEGGRGGNCTDFPGKAALFRRLPPPAPSRFGRF